MTRKAGITLAAAAVLCLICLVFWLPRKPLAPPVTMSHYRFLLHNVSETSDWPMRLQRSPYHQVCVTVQIQRADQYRDSSTNRPSLYGSELIPYARLTTKEGVSLHLLDAQAITEDPLHFTFVHHIYDKFNPEGDEDNFYMVYVFENPEQYKSADFEADVHIPAYDANGTRNAEQPPFVRPLHFTNLRLP